jgi:hypothetical protein
VKRARGLIGWAIVTFGLLLLAVLLPWAAWYLIPAKPIAALIVDKTVPENSRREHTGLMWALNHLRYTRTDGEPWRYERDYAGFIPLPNGHYQVRPLPSTARGYDLIYLADTYGVYVDDFERLNVAGTHSPKIYGGMSPDEVRAVREGVESGATLVGEFNTFASPTTGAARAGLEDLFGVTWTGWAGRRFDDLTPNVEVPVWAVSDYAKQYGRPWNFTGPGILFVHESGRLVVLAEPDDIALEGVTLGFEPGRAAAYHARDAVPYHYWFDIVTPRPGTTTEAHYDLALTDHGRLLLARAHIPATFPAILRRAGPRAPIYYFAGDFADNRFVPSWTRYRGAALTARWMPATLQSVTNLFYWRVYVPLIETVLSGVHHAPSAHSPPPM